jgi:hypothetical protein
MFFSVFHLMTIKTHTLRLQTVSKQCPKLVFQNSIEEMVAYMFLSLVLGLPAIVVGQQLVSFDDAKASSNFAPSFGARAATKESSGYVDLRLVHQARFHSIRSQIFIGTGVAQDLILQLKWSRGQGLWALCAL